MGNKSTTASNAIDLNGIAKETGFSLDEVELWHKSFMNDCPSGKLSRKKFYKVYKQFYPYGKPLKFSSLIFNTFDRDQDNKLNFNEFLTALSIILHGDMKAKLICAFQIYDYNNDGVIDKKEMKTVIDSIYELIGEDMKQLKRTRLSEKKVDEIFEKLDTNKDNFITLEEFMDGYINDEYLVHLLNVKCNFKSDLNDSLSSSAELSEIASSSDETVSSSSTSAAVAVTPPPYEDYETEFELFKKRALFLAYTKE